MQSAKKSDHAIVIEEHNDDLEETIQEDEDLLRFIQQKVDIAVAEFDEKVAQTDSRVEDLLKGSKKGGKRK